MNNMARRQLGKDANISGSTNANCIEREKSKVLTITIDVIKTITIGKMLEMLQ